MKGANYDDAFIEVAEDCPVATEEVPSSKGHAPSIPIVVITELPGDFFEFKVGISDGQ